MAGGTIVHVVCTPSIVAGVEVAAVTFCAWPEARSPPYSARCGTGARISGSRVDATVGNTRQVVHLTVEGRQVIDREVRETLMATRPGQD